MEKYDNIPSLRKHVLTKEDKDVNELEKIGKKWTKVAHENKLSYEIDWLGVPIIQTPEDLVLMQELVFKIKPDIVIETGIAHGGSLVYYASLLELLGKGKVIGIDIDIRDHNKKVIESHPLYDRIEMIQGSSTSQDTIDELKKRIPANSKILVCLDSDHTKKHVLQELKLYQQFVNPGCYIVVFDTITSELAKLGALDSRYIDNGPKEAVDEFLKKYNNFEIDKEYNKLYISTSQNGYLRRTK
jgi:cephalosporin hydroxylase